MRELRETALDLAKIILSRLLKSFDEELSALACEAEGRLAEDFIPLQNQGDWELHHMPEILYRHSWREIIRNWSKNICPENGVAAIQWLATSEEHVPQLSWV